MLHSERASSVLHYFSFACNKCTRSRPQKKLNFEHGRYFFFCRKKKGMSWLRRLGAPSDHAASDHQRGNASYKGDEEGFSQDVSTSVR